MDTKKEYLQDWVIWQMQRGHYTFTKDDVMSLDLTILADSKSRALRRLVSRRLIMSPWQNFYVAIPMEYQLRGIVPPSFYMDSLMKFLNREYYVSLLSAAELNGASHQRAMVFQTTVSGGSIRSGIKNGTRLEFIRRNNIPFNFVKQVKTQMGYMNVSGPELTALDIILEEKRIGGLSRAAEILVELSESINWDDKKLPLLHFFDSATIQRLGYLLELIEQEQLAYDLHHLLQNSNRTIRRVPLKPNEGINENMSYNRKWKVVENYKVEIDEI